MSLDSIAHFDFCQKIAVALRDTGVLTKIAVFSEMTMGGKVPQESPEKGDNKAATGPQRPKGIVQTRYIFTVMMFLGFVIGISNRVALSVVIVGMLDQCRFVLPLMVMVKGSKC